MKAARAGHVEMVKILIDNGADVNVVEKNDYPVLVERPALQDRQFDRIMYEGKILSEEKRR